ncbi:MAG: glycosyltransferase family 2 protein [Verrucomicrobia bacterium]|nr:glycosyltransferase family 2 protein [Verrucomicrobiota bacterium]
MTPDSRLTVVIPAFNEEKTIGAVLTRLFECVPTLFEVLIVDDASRDGTAEQCRVFAERETRIRVLTHRQNLGKTAALRTAFEHAHGDIIVIQDADLEYDPQEIPALIDPIVLGKADVCLGSRFLVRKAGRVLYFRHFLANKVLTLLSNILTDLNLTDIETGYKAARGVIFRSMLIESRGFGFEIEFVAKCRKIDARIYEVPISYYGRTYEEGKKIGVKDGIDALWYILKFNLLRNKAASFRSEPRLS